MPDVTDQMINVPHNNHTFSEIIIENEYHYVLSLSQQPWFRKFHPIPLK